MFLLNIFKKNIRIILYNSAVFLNTLKSNCLNDSSNYLRPHGKSVGLLQWNYFCQKLEENAEKFENVIVYTDKYYPSSQICSKCGQRHPEMKDVTNRTLKCRCGNIIDRDYNSALNLLKFGETVVYNKSYQTLGKELWSIKLLSV